MAKVLSAIDYLRKKQSDETRKLTQLREKNASIHSKAKAESRELSDEEKATINSITETIMNVYATLEEQSVALQKMLDDGGSLDDDREDYEKDIEEKENDDKDEEQKQRNFVIINGVKYYKTPQNGNPKQSRQLKDVRVGSREYYNRPEYRQAFAEYMVNNRETRTNTISLQSQMGFLIPPIEVVNKLIKKVDRLLFLRNKATKIEMMGAISIGIPGIANDFADADWTTEIVGPTEDTSNSVDRRDLQPTPYQKLVKASYALVQRFRQVIFMTGADAEENNRTINSFEDFITDRFGYVIGRTEEKAFISGSGVKQPLGLFTASNRGISTARDYNSGSSTGVTFAGLRGVTRSIVAGYKPEWLISRDFLLKCETLLDNQNRPLLTDPLTADGIPLLMGKPYNLSEFVPTTFTSNSYVGIFGDLSQYVIGDGVQLQLMVLNELYSGENSIGFKSYREVDGMPVNEEAFTRIKCAV